MKLLLTVLFLLSSHPVYADIKTYCGRIYCANAMSGCRVNDGKLDLLAVLWGGGLDTAIVNKGVARAIYSLDQSCACVVGVLSYRIPGLFHSISAAYPVDEIRCLRENL